MLNSIEKLQVIKTVISGQKFHTICDEIIADIQHKCVVLDDYQSEIRSLRAQLAASHDEIKKELCE